MSRNTTIGLVVVVLLIVLGWYYIQSQKGSSYTQPQSQPQTTPRARLQKTAPVTASASPSETMVKNVVKITSSGFMPKNITIKAVETVSWINDDTQDHTVNSAVHPTHQLYPPLNLGVVKSGASKSLTFPKAGTYKYHDHLNPSLTGIVTVQ